MLNFPQYNANRKLGDKGFLLVKLLIESDLDWILRENHLEDDFGIDGYIDIIGYDNSVTGKSLAIQVKTGDSFFRTETLTGWTFYGENKHLNYYSNLDIPLLIIIVNADDKKVYWEHFSIEKISKTPTGWSILIPKRNELGINSKKDLIDVSGDVIDYLPQIEYQWTLNEQIKDSNIILLNISQKEVLNLDTSGLTKLLQKLTINDEMIKKSESKLTFFIDGYNHDGREIYEIKEVRDWMKKAFSDFKYWGYFFVMKEDDLPLLTGLRLITLCLCDCEIIKTSEDNLQKYVEYDILQSIELMDQIFHWLNEFTDMYNIPEEINYRKSMEITHSFNGHLK